MLVRTYVDLTNKYNEISKICHDTNQPIYITKDGCNDLVVLSSEAYEKFEDLKSFKEEICKKIEKGLNDIKLGRYVSAEEGFREMEEKYNLDG